MSTFRNCMLEGVARTLIITPQVEGPFVRCCAFCQSTSVMLLQDIDKTVHVKCESCHRCSTRNTWTKRT